ncbi:MAG: endonuclease/exonuclease/phosphatase family protein [Terriglobales bacterium]
MLSLKSLSRIALATVLFLAIAWPSIATAQSTTPANVMTYNVDEGTDFTAITAVLTNPNATADDFIAAVTATVNEVAASNLPLRAQLIAARIAEAQPDLVGLQEAALWTFGGQQFDLLQMILDELTALGEHYTAVVTVTEFQLDLTEQLGVGFVDRDVILVRTNNGAVQITGGNQGHYSVLVPLPAFPPYLPATYITRGWGYVDVRLQGKVFRFITTHLEDGTNPLSIFALVQGAQAIELVYGPALTPLPVIMAGDFNVVANDPSSVTYLTYRFLLANGFADAWRRVHPDLVGATCCQENLQDPNSDLTQRLDLAFTRNHVGAVGAQLVGDQIDETSGYWPSDHTGVFVGTAIAKVR